MTLRYLQYMNTYLNDLTEEERLAELLDINRALDEMSIIAVTDQRGVIRYANDRFCEISGYSREELMGVTHAILNSDYHDGSFWKDFWGTIAKGKVWRGDILNRAKNGRSYWVDTTIVPFVDKDGKVYKYLAIRNEITEKKLLQLALNRLVDLASEKPDKSYFIDIVKTLCEVLEVSSVSLSGLEDDEVELIACWNQEGVCSPEDISRLSEVVENSLAVGQDHFHLSDLNDVLPDYPYCMGTILRDDKGEAIATLMIADDRPFKRVETFERIIGLYGKRVEIELKRRQTLRALKESEERMKAVVSSAADGIIIIDEEEQIESLNPAACEIFGLKKEGNINLKISQLLPRIDIEDCRHCQDEGADRGHETIGLHRDGSDLPLYYTCSTFELKGQTFFTLFVRNLTEQKLAEQKLKNAEDELYVQTLFTQRLSALAAMAGGIAHELNQPLSSIRVYAQMVNNFAARPDNIKPEKISQTMDKVINQVDRAAKIINHMRQFSSDKSDQDHDAKVLSLKSIVDESLDLIGQQLKNNGITLINEVDETHMVKVNQTRLEQVLINLISNAKDSINEKKFEVGEDKTIQLISTLSGDKLELEVIDSGTGIKAEVKERLFEPFVTSKAPGSGTGLGLSICLGILRDYKASIELEDTGSYGTRFKLIFPRV